MFGLRGDAAHQRQFRTLLNGSRRFDLFARVREQAVHLGDGLFEAHEAIVGCSGDRRGNLVGVQQLANQIAMMFGEARILDRFLQTAEIIEITGKSYRLKDRMVKSPK